MATKRRSRAEVEQLYIKTKELIDGGMSVGEALEKTGASDSPFRRWMRGKKGAVGVDRLRVESGSVRASSLPPRPKKGAKRKPKALDMNDIGAVANRIAKLDRKLRNIEDMVRERVDLVAVLVKLLKVKK